MPSDRLRVWDLTILSALSVVAFVLRFRGLDTFGFWWDELYHVVAAQSYLEMGGFYVPFRDEYGRAKIVTLITSWMFRLFGESEITARLPSVIFNVLFLWVSYFLVTPYVGRKSSLFLVLFLSANPLAIVLSREVRMYPLFQLFYFLGAAFFYKGVSGGGGKLLVSKLENRLEINIIYLALSAAFFWVSWSLAWFGTRSSRKSLGAHSRRHEAITTGCWRVFVR